MFTENEKLYTHFFKLEQNRARGQYPGVLMEFKMPMKPHHNPALYSKGCHNEMRSHLGVQ